MLIEQFAGAVLALLVQSALGLGAAKACAIGLGLFRRPISFRTLPELLQIDGFPHNHSHHPSGWVRVTIPAPRKLSRMALIDSVRILKNPRRLKFKNHISLYESGIFLCSTTMQCSVGR
jgi:hypothetical protein